MRFVKFVRWLLIFLIAAFIALNLQQRAFQSARQQMYWVYFDNPVTLYCGCTFNENKQVDWDSCGYEFQHKKKLKRARRVEAEHIVPASAFGRSLTCWNEPICQRADGTRYKGRSCCEKTDAKFRAMYTDLMNLAPAVGEVNADRSNYQFAVLEQGKGYGECNMWIDRKQRKAYPPERARGLVARTYLYMQKTYDFPLSDEEKVLFAAWDETYPEDTWEKTRKKRIQWLRWLFYFRS